MDKEVEEQSTETEAVKEALQKHTSIAGLLEELQRMRKENKKMRFREQRFAAEPLLRRRRLDLLSPQLLKILVIALQNELAAARDLLKHCEVADHPLLRNKLPSLKDTLMRDLQQILKSGIATAPPLSVSVADLSQRQQDLVVDSLRESNRTLRQQIMRLNACLSSMPGVQPATGPNGSPRLGGASSAGAVPSLGTEHFQTTMAVLEMA